MIEVQQRKGQANKSSLPPGWQWAQLKDVCVPDRRVVEPGSQFLGTRPYLGLEHVESNTGRILRAQTDVIADEGKSATFAFDARHVLYGKLRPYLNKVAVPGFAGRCTMEMIPLLPLEGTDRMFLAWLLRREETVQAAMREKTGSRMPRADIENLLELEIPLPPPNEQQRIANILTEQMATAEKARMAAMAQLNAAKLLIDAELRSIFNSQAANKWPRKRLDEISHLVSGGTPFRGNPESFRGTIPWVKTLDLNGAWVHETEEHITEAALREIRGGLLPVGTLMIAMYGGGGTIGKSGILGIPATTNQAICSVLPKPDAFVPEFLHAWLLLIRPQWMLYSSGNRKDPNISKSSVEQMQCPLPPLSEQRQIVVGLSKHIAAAEAAQCSLKNQLDTINKLPASLLHAAFTRGI